MPHIASFSIESLAGREEHLQVELDRNLNIFFGLNGSGKTSLLKILHSALSNDPSILSRVPFQTASVSIIDDDGELVERRARRVTRDDLENWEPENRQLYWQQFEAQRRLGMEEYSPARLPVGWVWETHPVAYAGEGWSHRYLPTWRLYPGPEVVGRRRTRYMTTDEVDWDSAYADVLRSLWKDHSAHINYRVREIQTQGLAEILALVLSPQKGTVHLPEADEKEIREAYTNVKLFLSRQRLSGALTTRDAFSKQYQTNANLRQVVDKIQTIEAHIAQVMAPQTAVQDLLTRMFIGNKQVTFSADQIDIRLKDDEELDVASLSSGEKHALRLFIEVLIARNNAFIIDEPEISLHIDWQHELVSSLRTVNPEAQLILASHSPEIMAEVSDKNIHPL